MPVVWRDCGLIRLEKSPSIYRTRFKVGTFPPLIPGIDEHRSQVSVNLLALRDEPMQPLPVELWSRSLEDRGVGAPSPRGWYGRDAHSTRATAAPSGCGTGAAKPLPVKPAVPAASWLAGLWYAPRSCTHRALATSPRGARRSPGVWASFGGGRPNADTATRPSPVPMVSCAGT